MQEECFSGRPAGERATRATSAVGSPEASSRSAADQARRDALTALSVRRCPVRLRGVG